MKMVVCSGVAIRLCRDKAWKITIHLRQGYGGQASNAPFSDRNKSFQAFLKTFEIASKTKLCYTVRDFYIKGDHIFTCNTPGIITIDRKFLPDSSKKKQFQMSNRIVFLLTFEIALLDGCILKYSTVFWFFRMAYFSPSEARISSYFFCTDAAKRCTVVSKRSLPNCGVNFAYSESVGRKQPSKCSSFNAP